MELMNATKMIAGYTMGMRPDGRESIVVVVKGTFTIPWPGEQPQLAEEQVPLVDGRRIHRRAWLFRPALRERLCPVQAAVRRLLTALAMHPAASQRSG